MSNFDECLKLVLHHEGGYVNHPKDPGGETNMGVKSVICFPLILIHYFFLPHIQTKGLTLYIQTTLIVVSNRISSLLLGVVVTISHETVQYCDFRGNERMPPIVVPPPESPDSREARKTMAGGTPPEDPWS